MNHLVKAGWTELKSINLSNHRFYSANNNIEDSGLEILCMGNWPKLNKLKIGNGCTKVGNNAITSAGMEHLSKCNWTDLTSLSVGITLNMQNKIRSGIKD